MEWVDHDGVELLECELDGARAAFSCRLGGVSAGVFESLNIGVLTGDRLSDVVENRVRLAAAIGLSPDRVLCARQVHGAELQVNGQVQSPALFAEPESFWGSQARIDPPEADAQQTSLSDLAALVFVADCLPIALSGAHGVCMVHGGWRGLAAGILERAVKSVAATSAAIGPGIGPCCFEVGEEVLTEFLKFGPGVAAGRMLDLPKVAERILIEAGMEPGSIQRSGHCTRCEPERFFSHRGQGPETGRQGGMVWIDG